MTASSETRQTTPDGLLWGGDTLVYRSIIALTIAALPLIGLANWLAYGTPWGPQLMLAAAMFAGALVCCTLSRRGMRIPRRR